MCLVAIAWQQHDEFPLIIVGNRDEFHSRPTEKMHCWPDQPNIVGGRDLLAGGTWLALHKNGRFATVTNYRDAVAPKAGHRSRGHLVTDFLNQTTASTDYLAQIDGTKYAGFNLLVSDGKSLAWHSNRSDEIRELTPGIYGLSNALLDSPWHKVKRAKTALSTLVASGAINRTTLFRLLDDRTKAPVDDIDSEHLSFQKAHAISAPFIVLPDYGTRSSSIVLLDAQGQWQAHERRFDASGKTLGDVSLRIN